MTLLFACIGFAGAQTASDIFNFSQMDYEGTARTMAMGNAFTALGGDLGALSIQPASSGVFGHSEMTFSPSFSYASSSTDYLDNHFYAKNSEFNISNFAALFHNENSNLNFAIGVNRIRDFNSAISAHGSTNQSSWLASQAVGLSGYDVSNLTSTSHDPYDDGVSWGAIAAWDAYLLSTLPGFNNEYIGSTENIDGNNLSIGGVLDQDFYQQTYGGITEVEFNIGGNLNDVFYWGANLNIQDLDYNIYQTYSETAQNVSDFQDGFDSFTKEYDQTTSGTGFNLKAGFIYRPTDALRIGAALQTPTFYTMNDKYILYMKSSFYNSDGDNLRYGYDGDISSPLGTYDYRMTTPFRFNLGIAYTFGSYALLSADYELVDYSQMKAGVSDDGSADSYDISYFDDLNDEIKSDYGTIHELRVGGELKTSSILSLRAGYQTYLYGSDSGTESFLKLLSFGAGLNLSKGLYFDFAYQSKLNTASSDTFTLYNDYDGISAPEGKITRNGKNKLIFTLGLRF